MTTPKDIRGVPLDTPEKVALAEGARFYWLRQANELCSDCGDPWAYSPDNPCPRAGRCEDAALCRLRAAAFGAALLFEQRTIALGTDVPMFPVMFLAPGTRVSWHEVAEKFGLRGPGERVAFQPLFEAALKRRGLLGVLKRRQSARDWTAKHHPRKRTVLR